VLRARGKYDEALALWAEAASAGTIAVELDLERGTSLLNAGRHMEAVDVLADAAVRDADDRLAARLRGQLARALMFAGRLDEALDVARRAVLLARDAADPREEAGARRMEGDVLFRRRDLEAAEAAWSAALALAGRTGTADEEAGLLLNLGMLEVDRGNPGAALVHDQQAVAAFERIAHGSGMAVGYGNIAEVLLQLGQVDECLSWCDKATECARSIGHLGTLADVGRTRALALQTLGEFTAASTAALQAAQLYAEMNLLAERDACLQLVEAGAARSR
jgi:tetratricopeptide (TPR) repeat protein